MDPRNIWFPYEDFETWSSEYQKDATAPSRLSEDSDATEHTQPSSSNEPRPCVYRYSNLLPGPLNEAPVPTRSFDSFGPPHQSSTTTQGTSETVAPREKWAQMPELVTSSGIPSQVSASSTPSNTVTDHSYMSSNTNATGEPSAPASNHDMPGSQVGSIRLHHPSTLAANQTSSRPEVEQPPLVLHAIDEGFVKMSFPLHTTDHLLKREALRSVMISSWKLNNQFEPEASLLLQFMRHDTTEGRWYCSFWRDGKACPCSCKKKDHAKGHIRSHLDLLPESWHYYARPPLTPECLNSPTSSVGCGRRYPAIEPLQKHRKGKATCENCGMSILPANLKRHMASCPGRAANEVS
ncbi:hypothetical protein PIIN_05390 [Serendipita indica DSM 11827]|uniref:Uncharacterized protein n=1 Tax=Serendipita indica (strain DSM 11827) TaxID=1109443 RepID=G4TJF8_SERID|nr:hypothetical protein PIIN_05390 [Serendipita indica DSM 11827]